MRRKWAFAVTGLAGTAAALGPAVAPADVIHLTNGNRLDVEAWREAGDTIEFASGGGIVGIRRSDVLRIDGKPTRGDLPMYSAPIPTLDPAGAAKRMAEYLQQGEGLFGQAVLSPAEKAGAFRRLGDLWREFQAPEALREVYDRGQRALQMAAEAFTAEGQGTVPDVRERIETARSEIQAAQEDLRKAGEQKG